MSAMIDTPPVPDDLALLGWTRRGSQLFAPDAPLSICMRSFPPPECFNVARDQPWHAAEIGARMQDAERAKSAKRPKKAKRAPVVAPVEVQEAMQL